MAWDDLLRGGRDKYPVQVARRFRTIPVGTAGVGDWELRGAEVTSARDELIPMTDGWPYGRRPAEARHPRLRTVRVVRNHDAGAAPGVLRTVTHVASDGSLLVDWDMGQKTALVPGEDVWDELTPAAIEPTATPSDPV